MISLFGSTVYMEIIEKGKELQIIPQDYKDPDLTELATSVVAEDTVSTTVSATDDPSFLRQVAALTVRDVPLKTSNEATIDTRRIYMAGHSNGCMAAIATATLHSDMVAAVGCHAGTALAAFPDSYKPTPMWLVHGMEDDTVSFDGDDFFLGQIVRWFEIVF